MTIPATIPATRTCSHVTQPARSSAPNVRLVRSRIVADIVVVGAGMGGLAVAARLSSMGHSVTVAEQSAACGGKVSSFGRDGFTFDTGPSLLTLPAVYRDLFLKTAVRRQNAALEDNVGLIGLDPAFGYRWADGTRATLPGSNPTESQLRSAKL